MKPGSNRLLLLTALCGLLATAFARAEGSNLDSLPSLDVGASLSTTADSTGTTDNAAGVTPESAAQGEVNDLSTQVGGLKENSANLDAAQQKTRKKLNGILDQAAVRVNGLGRVWVWDDRFIGNGAAALPAETDGFGFLDLWTSGIVGKDVQWRFLGRVRTGLVPSETDGGDVLSIRRVTGVYNPSFMKITLGDFDESYTSLTLWNRSSLDQKATPEFLDRRDKRVLYESHLDAYPLVPLRGIRLGVKFDHPGSKILQGIEASTFVHMIKNGFNGGSYGAGFTDWCVGGKGILKFRPWLTLESYGMLYNQPADTNGFKAVYDFNNSSTWPHRTWVGSLRPKVERGLACGLAAGVQMEMAGVKYEADLYRAERTLIDFAYLGGPYLRKGTSTLKFQYLEVGPSYYSPFAQFRQTTPSKSVTQVSDRSPLAEVTGYPAVTTLGDPGVNFMFYDRTYDNIFPYGLATPNRKGFGLEGEMRWRKEGALALSASAYQVKEIQRNLVVDSSYTYLVPVEDPTASNFTLRKFTYVNVGLKWDLAKQVKRKLPLEVCLNARSERTENALGSLKSSQWVPGIRVGLLKGVEIQSAYRILRARGMEYGYLLTSSSVPAVSEPSELARYSYWYDPTDRGQYAAFSADTQGRIWSADLAIQMGASARLDLEGSLNRKTDSGVITKNQSLGMVYELQF